MRLTPFAKLFITVVIVAVLGYAFWHYKGADLRKWAVGDKPAAAQAETPGANDFDALKNAPADPDRGTGSTGVTATSLASGGKLGRTLVVGINTWAGHAPGIVFNGGMDPSAASNFRKKFGLDVKFVLLEDPAAKLAAFRKGDIDIMWNTVDNWAREASILEENGAEGQVDPDAGLVARRRRHRVARLDQVDRGPEGQEGLGARSSRRRTSCCSTCSRSRGCRPRIAPRSRRTSSSRRTRRRRPRCSRLGRWTRR